MESFAKLTDRQLLKRTVRAERLTELWHERALRCCNYLWWEIDETPRGQDAHHLYLFWDKMKRRLHAEEDRRGPLYVEFCERAGWPAESRPPTGYHPPNE